MLIDTHCHLASRKFAGDLPDVLARARAAGVGRMVAIGTDLEDSPQAIQIAGENPDVFATAGIHPTDVTEVMGTEWRDKLRELARQPKVVAMGETGLDYYHEPPKGWDLPRYQARQAEFFHAHMELAVELGLNVVVHQRECAAAVYAQVKPFAGKLRAVFHCFSGTTHEALATIEEGHFVSFTGNVTYKSAQALRDTVKALPAGSFFLETDSPYLAPVPHRGKRNEPAFVPHIAACLAEVRGQSVEELAEETARAAEEFFRFARFS